MTVNGKRDNFQLEDLITIGKSISIKKPQDLIAEVAEAVARWPEFAGQAEVKENFVQEISDNLRILQ
jgi:serine/threonine-protein kinase HipA